MFFKEHPMFFEPDWPAPAKVRAFQTLRTGGESLPPFGTLNLGLHVGDDPVRVQANRDRLFSTFPGVVPLWMTQVHGTRVLDADAWRGWQGGSFTPEADAAVTKTPGLAVVVMTADCLPVLFCDRAGRRVAVAHAGWRGLCAGVLENTVRAMDCPPDEILAWMGPTIGSDAFEVGPEVYDAFVAQAPEDAAAFVSAGVHGKWRADLFALAQRRLETLGLRDIYGGGECTVSQPDRYFSYRRDGKTGRMATTIWLTV